MLARTGFTRPTFAEALEKKKLKDKAVKKVVKKVAKKKVKKPKLLTITQLHKLIWIEVKRIIRARYESICYTSGQTGLTGANFQTGHGISRGSLPIKYKNDLRNLRPQSYYENIHNGGNSYVFVCKLEKEKEGLEFLQEACYKDEHGIWRARKDINMGSLENWIFLTNQLEEYKKIER